MKTSERLLERLRDAGLDLPPGTRLQPIRASRADRNNGAWSWTAVDANGVPLTHDADGRLRAVGSHYPMADLLRLGIEIGHDRYGDICIDPPLSALREN